MWSATGASNRALGFLAFGAGLSACQPTIGSEALVTSRSGSENLYYFEAPMDVFISREVVESLPEETRKCRSCIVDEHRYGFPMVSLKSYIPTGNRWEKHGKTVPKKWVESENGVETSYTISGYYLSEVAIDKIDSIRNVTIEKALQFRDFVAKSKDCKLEYPMWETNFVRIFSAFKNSPECIRSLVSENSNLFDSVPIRSRIVESARPNLTPDLDRILADNSLKILNLYFRLGYSWDEPHKSISMDQAAKISKVTQAEVQELTGGKFSETDESRDKFEIAALDYTLRSKISIQSKEVDLEFREILFEFDFIDPAWNKIAGEFDKYDIIIANGHAGSLPTRVLDAIEAAKTPPSIAILNACFTLPNVVQRPRRFHDTDYVVVSGETPFISYSQYTVSLLKMIIENRNYRSYLNELQAESENALRKAKILYDAVPIIETEEEAKKNAIKFPNPPIVYIMPRKTNEK